MNTVIVALSRMALLSVLLLAGCAIKQPLHDPAYAPVEPVPVPTTEQNNGAIFSAANGVRLFEDVKARNVGDILTIRLVEQTNASKSASTSTSKGQDIDIGGPTLFGRSVLAGNAEVFETQVSAERDFEGEGESSQSNQLSGNITVMVAQVLPNGNLIVRGEKLLTLNQGDEFIRFSGIVRPVDVNPDNTVLSTRVANARIIYGGKGAVAESNAMGWLARFFQSAFFPF